MSATQGTVPQGGDYQGQATPYAEPNLVNALDYMIRQVVAEKAFASLVKVLSVTGGGVSAPPPVSVQPMVNQIDGNANQTPHGEIFDIPVFRMQAGNAAVIIDPVVGDIGAAIICDRDISNVKQTGAPAGPGSFNQNDYADGLYFGEFLGGTPENYVQVTQSGMNIVSTGTIAIMSAMLTHNGRDIGSTHEHTLTQPGAGNSGPPRP